MKSKIAIIGSGIAGLSAAYFLQTEFEVTLFEKNNYLGGHANTQEVEDSQGNKISIDTGFIVYNEHTYPNLTKLFNELQVPTSKSDMSFSFYNSQNNFEYGGGSLRSLFANPKNIYNPKFYRMLKDIVFFYKKFQKSNVSTELSIKDYLNTHSYSQEFINNHLLPLISSIWSTPDQNSLDQPLSSIITFFQNHQLFNFIQRPQWKTVSQGSSNYIKRLVAASNFQIKMNATITSINRKKTIQIDTKDEKGLSFDFIIFACPPHQFLPLLDHPTDAERNILSTFQFQQNHIQLHQNTAWMPPHPTAWSSWNFHSNKNQQCTLTYWMNLLQPLPTKDNFFVSLNQNQPNALYETYYDHPIFSLATKQAQQHIGKIQGGNNTYYVGSYLGYGFHEDGIQSSLKVCEKMNVDLANFKDADTSRVIWN